MTRDSQESSAPGALALSKPCAGAQRFGFSSGPSNRSTIGPESVLRGRIRQLMVAASLLLSGSILQAAEALFDAHLHYNAEDADRYSPQQIVSLLRDNGVRKAVVTSRPPQTAMQLHSLAPDLVIPLLGVYRTPMDKQRLWLRDKGLPDRVERALTDAAWRGVGELHIFALDRHNPVFVRIVRLAEARKLPLLIHSDPAVIDALFEHAPNATVIWAHAGAYPFPALLRDYLQRYPNLYVDLSVREQRLAPEGELSEDWEWLLIEFSERFLVGVDTYRTSRWSDYSVVAGKIRNLLDQLPTAVAENIAFANAERLFSIVSANQVAH